MDREADSCVKIAIWVLSWDLEMLDHIFRHESAVKYR